MRFPILRFPKTLLAVCVGLLLASGSAFALNGDTMDRWIASMDELQQWSNTHGEQLMTQDAADEDGRFDFEKSMNSANEQFPEVGEIIKRHGFEDIAEWAASTNRIFNAFARLKLDEAAPGIEAQLQEMEKEMREPGVTAEEREVVQMQIDEQRQSMKDFGKDVPEQDLQTVREREQELDAMFKG
jgi:hypothetical protein